MKQRFLIRVAQTALRGLAHTAEHIDDNLRSTFDQVGLPTPERTRGQEFAQAVRSYAARLDKHLPARRRR